MQFVTAGAENLNKLGRFLKDISNIHILFIRNAPNKRVPSYPVPGKASKQERHSFLTLVIILSHRGLSHAAALFTALLPTCSCTQHRGRKAGR